MQNGATSHDYVLRYRNYSQRCRLQQALVSNLRVFLSLSVNAAAQCLSVYEIGAFKRVDLPPNGAHWGRVVYAGALKFVCHGDVSLSLCCGGL